MFLASETYTKHKMMESLKPNHYFNQAFCTTVLEIILCKIATTSKLMLGNLMKHMDDTTIVSQKRLFDEYSKKCEKLAKSSFQTMLENNRTQGIIGQHFRDQGFKTELLERQEAC